jgi:hypothetical protein
VEARDPGDHLPQGFFRKRLFQVVGAEPCFHVSHGDLVVKTGQRSLKRALRVALHDHDRPWLLPHDRLELLAATDAEVTQRCAAARQGNIGDDIEARENLPRHLVMLAGMQPLDTDVVRATERVIQRRQLDDFRPRAGDEQDVSHHVLSLYRQTARSHHQLLVRGTAANFIALPTPAALRTLLLLTA